MLHVDTRTQRTALAGVDHTSDRVRLARKYGLHRSVAAVAHPAFEPAPMRFDFDESAKADALDATMHDDVADDTHAISPTSMTRAPVQREVDQRSTERA
jgi:hypothetical protein